MSASIYWKQVKPIKGNSLGVGAPSFFLEAMRKAFEEKK